MERLTLRTAKSWGGVPVREWQEEWSPRSSSRWQEALDGRSRQSASITSKMIVKGGQREGDWKLWETEGQLLSLVCERFSWFQLSIIQAWAVVLAHIFQAQRVLLMNQLAPGSHRVILFDLQKIFSFLPSQDLLSASVSCLSYSWKSEKHKKTEELIQRAQTGCAGIHTSIGHSTWKEEKDMRSSRPASIHSWRPS